MIFVDIYNSRNYSILGSFELEFDWQYDEIDDFEDKLTENGIDFFEIVSYQQED